MPNTHTDASKLVSYLDLQARKLRVDLQAARLFVGTTDVGSVAENAVRRFLQSTLPARYSVGVGEVIGPKGQSAQRVDQTQQKDVLVYDPYGCAAFGWDESAVSLFPVESIYAVIEVKTSIRSTEGLLKAIDQTLEVKRLCQAYRNPQQESPFTGVFALESRVQGDSLFGTLKGRPPDERADFVLVLNPKPTDVSGQDNSFYFAHWHYHSRGGGPVDFVSADEAGEERSDSPNSAHRFLTFCETERALLWFYLFLFEQLDRMRLIRPNLWHYANADQQRLGWRDNE